MLLWYLLAVSIAVVMIACSFLSSLVMQFIHTYTTWYSILTIWSDYQGFTLISLLTTTVDTTYWNVVLIVCNKTSQFILCDICDVQKTPIWGMGSISGNTDAVKISTVITTQCPVHSDVHRSIFRKVNTVEGWDRGGTWNMSNLTWVWNVTQLGFLYKPCKGMPCYLWLIKLLPCYGFLHSF